MQHALCSGAVHQAGAAAGGGRWGQRGLGAWSSHLTRTLPEFPKLRNFPFAAGFRRPRAGGAGAGAAGAGAGADGGEGNELDHMPGLACVRGVARLCAQVS